MKVLKFGGTSVGSITSLLNVKRIVETQSEPVIVVVSALSGVTDQLVAIAGKAQQRDASYEQDLARLLERHNTVIDGVVPPSQRDACKSIMQQFIMQGLAQYAGVLLANPQLPAAERDRLADAIVSHGEILSSAIVSSMIEGAVPHFSPQFIKTKDEQGERILDPATFGLIAKEWQQATKGVHVTQGFIAQDSATGMHTNLGRGGSDFTAALIAAALDASSLEIWTDVDGFYTADPKKDPNARLLDEITYEQAQQMCDAGAKVIYAPTLSPVAIKGIPVWVKNTFNPQARGTRIGRG